MWNDSTILVALCSQKAAPSRPNERCNYVFCHHNRLHVGHLPRPCSRARIYVIPLHVIIEGEDLLDQVQITAQEYVARMAGSEQLPHTSQPSAGEFKALFDRVRADGHDSAIFISLCSEWSACYANACQVADTHELDVRCIDSRTGSGAEGLLVEYALAMREDGRSLDETEAQIRATLPDATCC